MGGWRDGFVDFDFDFVSTNPVALRLGIGSVTMQWV